MPTPRASDWSPIAVILFVGLVGTFLGLGKTPQSSQGRKELHRAFNADAHAGMHRPAPFRPKRLPVLIGLVLALLLGSGVYAGYRIKLTQNARFRAVALTGGDPDQGRRLIRQYGCAGCHTIPGVPGAQGKVGPTLDGFAARVYIGGVAGNSPEALMQWIEDPRSIDPKTAMPATGISRAEARHVAAYLYSLP